MKRENDVKELLISNAITLIAQGGFEKATTKELTHHSGHLDNFKMNEAYIYRCFGNKEKLFEAMFITLDNELFSAFQNALKKVGDLQENTKEKLNQLFLISWNFVLQNEQKCRCYIRYYYSIYFNGSSIEAHNELANSIFSELKPIFKEEANVEAIMHSVFTMLFDFAIRVYNGTLLNNDDSRTHIFNVLYCMLMSYLKN